jgi:TetR/AcrR family transcriptional regulator, regulator of cefoperazone and chloramphenicol sensitivity
MRAMADLTARARIRDAALRLFAERGVEAATIRDIASAAGVSSGLVRHHFGAKEELRRACDEYALNRLMEIKQRALDGGLADPGFLPTAHPTQMALVRYLTRSMLDGSTEAAALFDNMVDLTEQWITKHHNEITADPRAFAAVLVAMMSGPLVLHEQLSRVLGTDALNARGRARVGRVSVDILAQALLTPELATQARAAYDRLGGQT